MKLIQILHHINTPLDLHIIVVIFKPPSGLRHPLSPDLIGS